MARDGKAAKTNRSTAQAPAPARGPQPSGDPDPLSQAILHENLDDKIHARLRQLLVERRILPGDRIQVDRLARTFGVSRTPVVNALKRLAQEQVVEWALRRGVYVKRLSTRELARLFEVREVLEGLAARRAAPRITRAEVDRLTATFRGLDLTPHGPALQHYIECDRAFHLRLIELAGNPFLAHAMDAVNLMVFTYQMGLARPPAETIREHWAILAALRKQDPEASEAAMRAHMRRTVERMDREADAEDRLASPAAASRVAQPTADETAATPSAGPKRKAGRG
jgi:DNA-binding GntR family transcriptional regulator